MIDAGVEITKKTVRRERMGHLELAAPIAHIWFFKGIPNRIALMLDVSPKALERVIYFATYIVTESSVSDIKVCDILTESELIAAKEKYPNGEFKAETGAEALEKLLKRINLEELRQKIEKELEETRVRLGLLDITGEGISVILRDNESTIISANDILTLVNQLIISGAEAISINGNRFMNNTEIVAVNGKDILINSKKITSPYRILAIGNKKNLESGISTKDRIYKPNACKW